MLAAIQDLEIFGALYSIWDLASTECLTGKILHARGHAANPQECGKDNKVLTLQAADFMH